MANEAQQGSPGNGKDGGRADPPVEPGKHADLDARRDRLAAKLASREAEREKAAADSGSARNGYALAVRLSSEFIAAVAVGAVLGYSIDRFVGTTPWGMIVMLLVGFCAGVLNVMRSAGLVAQPQPGKRRSDGTD